ncbi:hypothetical protein M0805_008326 [Coniferiporia weirii]|nr:hypothetical protein M0805_008326 [Coniferiporia weirii]
MALSSTSLAVSVAHAVTYLTRPLAAALPADNLTRLQAALEANLAAAYVATWVPSEPARGSGRRVLTFSPGALPPRPVYKACVAAAVDWAQWSRLLGGYEFDLLVDPGCVAVRLGSQWGSGSGSPSRLITVWADAPAARTHSSAAASRPASLLIPQPQAVPTCRKPEVDTQFLIEADKKDDEELFSMLAAAMSSLTWRTPVVPEFPADVMDGAEKVPAAARTTMGHSRSSSRSSVASSSALSFFSDESVSSCASLSSVSTTMSSAAPKRSRASRVYIDTSKTEVTPYDGGKTTVLTGGVMLGAAPAKNSRAAAGRKTNRF